jgi:putative transposase
MAQSLSMIYLHVIFSTKGREPLLADPATRARVHSYLGGICRDLETPALEIGGTEDHVHIACLFSRDIKVKDLVRDIKRGTSTIINEQRWIDKPFHWQNGYGVFSISPTHLDELRSYIQNQMEHHKTEAFQPEFRRILGKNRVEYDERYVWD